jgi:type III restriction enzyme
MKIKLFPFQSLAVENLRLKADYALKSYRETHTPQVVSLQAPTGSGKTVMMTAFIENILFGDERHDEMSNAVFVWLSDSPALNEQSKEKIELKSDKIQFGQCVTVEDASFDRETFEDGHIYFLNTQKLSRAGNLGVKSDSRQYTIWETIQNTIKEKSDRLFFVIDEAHRGMLGNEGGRQTAIMQRFLRGWKEVGLEAIPVVIGMSATPERFNKLVDRLSSTISKEIVPTDAVRASGLLKDRIIIKYPENPEKQDPMAVLAAATREWMAKCKHWKDYCVSQHYRNVEPVFVVQVKAASGENTISDTDIGAAIGKIIEESGMIFEEGEVVHTFGSVGDITVNGYTIKYDQPHAIAENRTIKVVFFKENLSTGWDCPRAETMMSFRRAEDFTYIAQLLGRMIRTPLQCRVVVDDFLNDVKLYLPYFNAETVEHVIAELRSSECGDIPAFVGGDLLDSVAYMPLGVGKKIKRKVVVDNPNQLDFFADLPVVECARTESQKEAERLEIGGQCEREVEEKPIIVKVLQAPSAENDVQDETREQLTLQVEIDRKDVIRRVNQMGIIKYEVRTRQQKINDYLVALLNLAGILTRTNIYPKASRIVREGVVAIITESIKEIRKSGFYEQEERRIREMRLGQSVFDAFGRVVDMPSQMEFAQISESDIDRQLREADIQLGRAGLVHDYGRSLEEEGDGYKIDCIIFAGDQACKDKVFAYAKKMFHELDDEYRKYIVVSNERIQNEYNEITASNDPISRHSFILPESVQGIASQDGKLYSNHLYADEEGFARIKLDSAWESSLIEEESRREDFVCWLRNQARQKWALCLPYQMNGEIKAFYPDFLIVRRDYKSPFGYVVDVLEPHSAAFTDNLAKAQALAKYAEKEFHLGRIQLVRESQGLGGVKKFLRLDLNKGEVRKKVIAAINDEELCHIFDMYAQSHTNDN